MEIRDKGEGRVERMEIRVERMEIRFGKGRKGEEKKNGD